MSQYVTIIETHTVQPVIAHNVDAEQLIKSSRIVYPCNMTDRRYWIGLTGEPDAARNGFARSNPFSFYGIFHAVRAENRSELLYEALRMKLREHHIIHGWYDLYNTDLIWLRNITTDNYAQIIPQIENEIAAANGVEVRDVTKRKASGTSLLVTELTPEQIDEQIKQTEAAKQALLDQIKGLL